MVPRPNISAEDKKAERQYSSGRRHAWEPEKVRQDDIILKRPAQRRIFFGGVVGAPIFGLAIVMLAGS